MTDRERAVRDAAVERFLQGAESLSADDMAAASSEPVNFVRSAIRRHGGSLPGLVASEERRPSFSKSYRGFQTGTHAVWVYTPTREHLRAMVLELRAQKSESARSTDSM